jgi:hypothetical protein
MTDQIKTSASASALGNGFSKVNRIFKASETGERATGRRAFFLTFCRNILLLLSSLRLSSRSDAVTELSQR